MNNLIIWIKFLLITKSFYREINTSQIHNTAMNVKIKCQGAL